MHLSQANGNHATYLLHLMPKPNLLAVLTFEHFEISITKFTQNQSISRLLKAVRIECFVYIKSCQFSMFYTNLIKCSEQKDLKNPL